MGLCFRQQGRYAFRTQGGEVSTIFNGTVASIWMDNRDSYLIRILVSHGEFSTIYCHMVDVVVKRRRRGKNRAKLGTLSPWEKATVIFSCSQRGSR